MAMDLNDFGGGKHYSIWHGSVEMFHGIQQVLLPGCSDRRTCAVNIPAIMEFLVEMVGAKAIQASRYMAAVKSFCMMKMEISGSGHLGLAGKVSRLWGPGSACVRAGY